MIDWDGAADAALPSFRNAMPRYAILEHDHPAPHWDFLLESGDVLLTWRLSAPPDARPFVDAAPAPDHRPLYLDYEGEISGGRGRVTRWDGGTFEWEARGTERVLVRLIGVRLRGLFRLERVGGGSWRGAFRRESAPSEPEA